MRRMLLLAASLMVLSNAGCFLQAYSSNPNTRMAELMNQSENLRNAGVFWEKFWMLDQPSHLSADRTDGGTR